MEVRMAKLSFEKCKNGSEYLAKIVQGILKEQGVAPKVLFRSTKYGPRVHFYNDLDNIRQIILEFSRGGYWTDEKNPLVTVQLRVSYYGPHKQTKKLELAVGKYKESGLSNPKFDIEGLATAIIVRMMMMLDLFKTFEEPFHPLGALPKPKRIKQQYGPNYTFWICEGCHKHLQKEDTPCRCT
jgi:hypothetical protein